MQKIRQAITKHLWWLTAIAGIALLLCHTLQIATITVDNTTLILLVLILVSPFVAAIKRLKIGEFEAEIDPAEVKRVTEDVARKLPHIESAVAFMGSAPSAVLAIRELAKTDFVVALAKLRIELETTLRRLDSRSQGVENSSPSKPTIHLIRDLAARQVIPRELTSSIRDVLALCNRAIHGEPIRDPDAQAVIESGGELLQALEHLVREYGVGHPVEKTTITQADVKAYYSARYRVVTIIPYVKSPQRVVYMFTHEELEDFFAGYSEYAEFVIGIQQIEPKTA